MSTIEPSNTLVIRSAMPSDYDSALQLDHTDSTDFVWQMAHDTLESTINVAFRPERLPRSMKVLYPRSGDALLRGIGTALLRAARDWALETKLRRLIVETQTKNYPAIRFLQKRGLVFCGYNDLFYPNQDIAVFFGQMLR
jgi:hypothetical protein